MDDVLIAGQNEKDLLAATEAVLRHLANGGFKVSKQKLQVCRRSVTFLGRILSNEGFKLTEKQKESILSYSKPKTVHEMMKFLRLINFSKTFVPDFSNKVAALKDLMTEAGYKIILLS